MLEESARWMRQADADLSASRDLLAAGHRGPSCFHGQQAAEKSLTAVLIARAGRFPRIHDLVALAVEAKAPDRLIEGCKLPSPAYVAARCPDAEIEFDETTARRLLAIAEEVLAWARQRLS